MDALRQQFTTLWDDAVEIWASGGWAMWVIAATAMVLFAMGVHVGLRLREKGFLGLRERTWRRWIDHPSERRGPIGELLDFVTGCRSLEQQRDAFRQLHMSETEPFDRDLKVMKICVSAAPLVGLLGTVTGMLTTFGALAGGGGGDQTMESIAGGISEALVTTETGLVIAIPGLFFQYHLVRQHDRYKAFLARLESVCAQSLHRRLQRETQAAR